MEKFKLIFFFLLIGLIGFSQDGPETNLWISGQFTFEKYANSHSVDGSFRSQDYFVRDPRQAVIRYTYSRKVGENFSLAGGLGLFENYSMSSENWSSELRPFIQGQFKISIKSSELRFRLRNELRYYIKSEQAIDRIRLQLVYSLPLNERLKFSISEELFYSPQLVKPFENRAFVGLQYSLKKNNHLSFQYLIHWQESQSKTIQNIIQITWSKTIKK